MKCFEVSLDNLIKVTMFGKTRLTSPEHHITRYIREHIIYFVAEGRLTLKQNDEIVRLSAGDVYFFGVGEHQEPLECENCLYYYVHFATGVLRELELDDTEYCERVKSRKSKFAKADIYSTATYDYMKAIIPQLLHIEDKNNFEQLVSSFKSHELSYANNSERYRINLSSTVARLFMKIEESAYSLWDPGYKGKNGRVYEIAKNILNYVETHYTENFCGADVEECLFINYDYANRVFKRYFEDSIINYRNRLRINTAKALMLDKELCEVARLTGFTNQYYFSRCFKKYEGVSPSEYKEQKGI